jgi:hypothetical protein
MSLLIHKFLNKLLWVLILLQLFLSQSIFAQETTTNQNNFVPNDSITAISAALMSDQNSIRVRWNPPIDSGDIIIARSSEVIDTQDKLFTADSMGIYPSDPKYSVTREFKDINLKAGRYYYAVAMVKSIRKREVKIILGQNSLSNPIIVGDQKPGQNVSQKETIQNIRMIQSIDFKKIEDFTRIHWVGPEDASVNTVYNVYRSNSKMDSLNLMKSANKIMEITHPENTFVDKSEGNGSGYYGISITENNLEYIPLREGISYISTNPLEQSKTDQLEKSKPNRIEIEDNTNLVLKKNNNITITEGGQERPLNPESKNSKMGVYVNNLNYELQDEGILFNWEPPKEISPKDLVYNIYRSTSPLQSLDIALEKGAAQKIGDVQSPALSFFLPKFERKKIYYFGVTVKQNSGLEDTDLVENISYVKIFPTGYEKYNQEDKSNESSKSKNSSNDEPKKKSEKNKDQPKSGVEKSNSNENIEFETIMTDYYKKGKYEIAQKKLEFLAEREDNPKEKAKALFYAALSNYHRKEYDKALKLLLDNTVQDNYDKERVDFYVNQCLEKRRNE